MPKTISKVSSVNEDYLTRSSLTSGPAAGQRPPSPEPAQDSELEEPTSPIEQTSTQTGQSKKMGSLSDEEQGAFGTFTARRMALTDYLRRECATRRERATEGRILGR